jgi:hypothetical protein
MIVRPPTDPDRHIDLEAGLDAIVLRIETKLLNDAGFSAFETLLALQEVCRNRLMMCHPPLYDADP